MFRIPVEVKYVITVAQMVGELNEVKCCKRNCFIYNCGILIYGVEQHGEANAIEKKNLLLIFPERRGPVMPCRAI